MKTLNYYLAGFVLLAMLSGLAIRTWKAQPIYVTTSKIDQNGLKYVGIFRGLPKQYQDLEFQGYDFSDQNRLWMFIEQDSSKWPNSLDFRLGGENGMSVKIGELIEAELPSAQRTRVYGRPVPEQYSPEFRNATLFVSNGAKVIANWKLQGMPEPTRLISSKERDHLDDHALGVKFAFFTPALQDSSDNGFASGDPRYWLADVAISGISDTGSDQYEISPLIERCEWHVPPFSNKSTQEISNGKTRIQLDAGYPFNASKIAFALTLRRFRTYDEAVVLRNVVIKRVDIHDNCYAITSCSNPMIETKSGINLRIDFPSKYEMLFQDRSALRIHSDQPADRMILPKSPLSKGQLRPIQLTLTDGSSGSGNDFTWFLPTEFNHGLDKVTVPELRIVLRQKLITAEQTMHYLLPARGARKGVWL